MQLKTRTIILWLALAFSLTMLAMSQAHAQANSSLSSDNQAFAGNQGVTLSNTYQTSPFSYGQIYGHQKIDTNQAFGASSSFGTNAVWRCATSGSGWSLQVVGGGLNRSAPGGESTICAVDFRIAVNMAVNKVMSDPKATKADKDEVLRLACADEALADAYEGNQAKQCEDVSKLAAVRKARWKREADARQVMSELAPLGLTQLAGGPQSPLMP